jgi:hypothetical protein
MRRIRIDELRHPLGVATRLNLRTFIALRNTCCDFPCPLGGFGDLLLTALGVLGRIFPKCTNLDIHR